MGFEDFSFSYDAESSRFSVFINEGDFLKKLLPVFVTNLDYVFKIVAAKKEETSRFLSTLIIIGASVNY